MAGDIDDPLVRALLRDLLIGDCWEKVHDSQRVVNYLVSLQIEAVETAKVPCL